MLSCALLRPFAGHVNVVGVPVLDIGVVEVLGGGLGGVGVLGVVDGVEGVDGVPDCELGDVHPISATTSSGIVGTGVCLLFARATMTS